MTTDCTKPHCSDPPLHADAPLRPQTKMWLGLIHEAVGLVIGQELDWSGFSDADAQELRKANNALAQTLGCKEHWSDD